MLDQLQKLDVIGLVIMLIGGVMTYGARFFVLKVFKFPGDEMMKPMIVMKLCGIIVAVIGMLKIMDVI